RTLGPPIAVLGYCPRLRHPTPFPPWFHAAIPHANPRHRYCHRRHARWLLVERCAHGGTAPIDRRFAHAAGEGRLRSVETERRTASSQLVSGYRPRGFRFSRPDRRVARHVGDGDQGVLGEYRREHAA